MLNDKNSNPGKLEIIIYTCVLSIFRSELEEGVILSNESLLWCPMSLFEHPDQLQRDAPSLPSFSYYQFKFPPCFFHKEQCFPLYC